MSASGNGAAPVSIVDVRLRLLEMVLKHSGDDGMDADAVVKAAQILEGYIRSPVGGPAPHPKS